MIAITPLKTAKNQQLKIKGAGPVRSDCTFKKYEPVQPDDKVRPSLQHVRHLNEK
jgi:hypothetical protein